jgi:CARDB
MRTLSLVVVATLATLSSSLVAAGPVQAKPPKPRAELVTKRVVVTRTGSSLAVTSSVKNKGNLKAGASVATFYLSADRTQSAGDTTLGTAAVAKIKPKKSKPASGVFALPATVAAGTYFVVVCADSGGAVKERKESNNCKGSTGTVQVAASGPVTVSATAGANGSVAASDVTGGTCAATTCTFPTAGTGTVTFTPTADSGSSFAGWTGSTCSGYTAGDGGVITFSHPTTSHACTATFAAAVKISWTVSPAVVFGSVVGTATNGTCTASDPITGAGSCTVPAGIGFVLLTATPTLPIPFAGWTGGTCTGAKSGNTVAFAAPTVAADCTANFL